MSKTVLITGSSSGIGLTAAIEIARRGHHVIATMRDLRKKGRLVAAARRAGCPVEILPLDVTSNESIAAAADRVHSRHGALWALVNNAGYGLGGFFEDLSEQEIADQFATNFFGVLSVTRAFLGPMRRERAGTIINVSSINGRVGVPCLSAYQSTKFALEGFSEGLWHELRPFGVCVVLIEPGMFRTEIFTSNIRMCAAGRTPRSPYYAWGQAILERTLRRLEKSAGDASVVGRAIADAIDDPSPGLRRLVGLDARVAAFLRWILPERVFLELVGSAYGQSAAPSRPSERPSDRVVRPLHVLRDRPSRPRVGPSRVAGAVRGSTSRD
jgi:NAD(P)-dependent dehydrogenase (short-subunit alcohol dehydrogenase family)